MKLTEEMTKTASKAMPNQKYQISQIWRDGRRCTTKQQCESQQQYKQYSGVQMYGLIALLLLSFLSSKLHS